MLLSKKSPPDQPKLQSSRLITQKTRSLHTAHCCGDSPTGQQRRQNSTLRRWVHQSLTLCNALSTDTSNKTTTKPRIQHSGFVSSHMRKSYCLPKGGQCLCGYTAKKTPFHLLTDRFSLHARLELPHESCRSQYYEECACLCMQGRRTEDCLSASVPPFPGTKHASTLSQEIT